MTQVQAVPEELEATVLGHLGDACRDTGELQRALQAWEQALSILDTLKHPDAEQVRARILGQQQPVAADAIGT